VKADNTQVQHN